LQYYHLQSGMVIISLALYVCLYVYDNFQKTWNRKFI